MRRCVEEVDRLLRGDVLVDLLNVVRQGVRASVESYSLKQIEKFYMPVRTGPVTEAGFSVVAFETWLKERDQAILDGIADYNRDDCVSTWMLRGWLEDRRTEAVARWPSLAWERPVADHQGSVRGRHRLAAPRRGARPGPDRRPRTGRPGGGCRGAPAPGRPARLASSRGEVAVVAVVRAEGRPDGRAARRSSATPSPDLRSSTSGLARASCSTGVIGSNPRTTGSTRAISLSIAAPARAPGRSSRSTMRHGIIELKRVPVVRVAAPGGPDPGDAVGRARPSARPCCAWRTAVIRGWDRR